MPACACYWNGYNAKGAPGYCVCDHPERGAYPKQPHKITDLCMCDICLKARSKSNEITARESKSA